MNRKERRAIGFTESRYRKYDDCPNAGWFDSAFVSYHAFDAYKLGNDTIQRTHRMDGKPRRWEVERMRRQQPELWELSQELGVDPAEIPAYVPE